MGVGIGMSCNLNGIVYDLREEGFNILFIPHARSTLDEVREAVHQITFDVHDDLVKRILDGTVQGEIKIRKALGLMEDEDEFNYRSEKYLSLLNAILSGDSLSLLSWVGRHAPKYYYFYYFYYLSIFQQGFDCDC